MGSGGRWLMPARLMSMFKRRHHQQIGLVLEALDGDLLRANQCLFGGGSAIALRHGEFRESIDMDFLISDVSCYSKLRQLLTGQQGIASICRVDSAPLVQARDIRADQYGIRTELMIDEHPIKFEIILEARIKLTAPGTSDVICGVSTLTPLDMLAGKLLANSDRWNDAGVFGRDLIDIAMMTPALGLFREAVIKSEQAYGISIRNDLAKAIARMEQRDGWLDRCMEVMAIELPKALLWQNIRSLGKLLNQLD